MDAAFNTTWPDLLPDGRGPAGGGRAHVVGCWAAPRRHNTPVGSVYLPRVRLAWRRQAESRAADDSSADVHAGSRAF